MAALIIEFGITTDADLICFFQLPTAVVLLFMVLGAHPDLCIKRYGRDPALALDAAIVVVILEKFTLGFDPDTVVG